jgi:glycosyltransferase involved in cell wall biosynthesis
MISLVIPSYNNLRHLKNAYNSVRKHYTDKVELILIDDGSDDGTFEWLQSLNDPNSIIWREEKRIGNTILYDKGINKATHDIVGILHADMYIAPNYIENLLKHLKPGRVVCGTRIEPPLHPEGKEKIIRNFGLDFDSLKINDFYLFAEKEMVRMKDKTTRGMFAPWVIYKSDFEAIGGHDPGFAPFPYEDSDIFQRWILKGYELMQSRDALTYHLTCRGHRWNKKIGKNDDEFKIFEEKSRKNYLRKWGSWVKNDEYQYPIILPKYDVGFIVKNCNLQLLELLEPWCSNILIDDEMQVLTSHYMDKEQKNTSFKLEDRIKSTPFESLNNEVLVTIDRNTFTQQDFQIIQQLSEIIQDSGEIGEFELNNLKIKITALNEYQNDLIKC